MFDQLRRTDLFHQAGRIGPFQTPKQDVVEKAVWGTLSFFRAEGLPQKAMRPVQYCAVPIGSAAKVVVFFAQFAPGSSPFVILGQLSKMVSEACDYLTSNPSELQPFLKNRATLAEASNVLVQGVCLAGLGGMVCLASSFGWPIVIMGVVWAATGGEHLWHVGLSNEEILNMLMPSLRATAMRQRTMLAG